jgi:PPOX class probable F420-dependent enzyme
MIRLSADEAWEVLAGAPTGILTTLRRDGWPITLPVWFVVDERSIAIVAPAGTKKVARVRNDPRASFLVESGLKWSELRAVHLTGRVELVEDEAAKARIDEAMAVKYAEARTAPTAMPEATRSVYATQAHLRLVPDERLLTWDNSRMPVKGSRG